ncbi:ABC transporter permease [Tissierella praeacuta]|uniref:ABC transporter permease n=1 Tax=Tissierella praeacuta TaxID=43131 RepID=UPI0028AD178B|nr:ABC transporter permease [Tissierella praeacuta]
MFKYSIKRLLQSLFTLFIIVTIVFLLMRLLPEEGYFGDSYEKLDEQQREAILTSMGLRDPIYKQLANFYKNILEGNLGQSITFRPKVPVMDIIKAKVPYSLYFGLAAIGISLLVGITLGIGMAKSKNKFWDKLGTGYVVFIKAVPAAVYFLFLQLYLTNLI